MEYAPIVLFVYNRLKHTQKTIKHLLNNVGVENSELYIFSDGCRNESSQEKVESVRNYISSIQGFKRIEICLRDKNMGLANSIIDGVTKIVNKHGRAIVLEDDIITNHFFLQYMNRALDEYADNKNVYSISSYAYVDFRRKSIPDTYFLIAASSWGWATWKDRWQKFDLNANGWEKLLNDVKLKYRFNLEGGCDWTDMLIRQMTDDAYDSWAIRWLWTIFKNKGLTLFPRVSMSANIGFDGSGVHCKESAVKNKINMNACIENYEKHIVENRNVRRKVSFYMKKEAFIHRCKNYIRKKLSKAQNIEEMIS